MTKETLKQTLEALEKLVDSFADVSAYEDEEHAFTDELILIPDIKKAIKAIAAAKQALAQPVQLVTWTGNGSAERRNIEAPRGYFFQVDRRLEEDDDIPWVNLTDEEWLSLGCKSVEEVRIGLAIQAKLKEKNT